MSVEFIDCWDNQRENQKSAYTGDPVLMSPEDKIRFVHWNIIALQAETVEMLDTFPWKPWSKNFGDPEHWDPEALVGEAADVMCFLTNLLLVAGVDAGQLLDAWKEKIERNAARQVLSYDVSKPGWKCPVCGSALDDPAVKCTEDACAK